MNRDIILDERRSSYQKLCSEYYDLYRPVADPKEVEFYSSLLDQVKGPILEAMCGSGRILIPLLKKGHRIDGVDNSGSMLENCAKRCASENLPVELYEQSLEDLALPKKYQLIFIALGSLQHYPDPSIALQALRCSHDHLLPGGRLIVDSVVPWGLIRNSIEDGFLSSSVTTISHEHAVNTLYGSTIISKTKSMVNPAEQIATIDTLYEKTTGREIIATEEERLYFRWYFRYEMQLMLERAGFTVTDICSKRFDPHLQSTIYNTLKA